MTEGMFKNKLTAGAACVCLLLVSAGGYAAEGKRTVVAGKVVDRTERDPAVMTWNLCDPIVDDRMGMRLADDGSFRFETDGITRFHNATLNYGRFINFFIAPGDSVYLTIDAGKLREGASDAVRFGGAHAEDNRCLHACYGSITDRFYAEPGLDRSADPDAMAREIRNRLVRYEDSLACFSLSPAVLDFMRRDMLFGLANQLLDYREDEPVAQLALFGDPMFGIHDTANFCTMMFPYHLGAYMQTKVGADSAVVAAGNRGDFAGAARGGIRILSSEPATDSRDVMLWQYLSDVVGYCPALCDSVPEAKSAFLDPALGEWLEALCCAKSGAPVFPDIPVEGVAYLSADGTVTAVPEGDVFAYLAAKYRGKVLYIDVYATWCGPCRAEMKEAPALHEVMRGKEVVFVNLCLASDREAWLRMVAQQKLEGENYWFDGDATNLFTGAYNLPGYPTYILVGRDGKIVTMKAERPSALTQAARQIDDLLAE